MRALTVRKVLSDSPAFARHHRLSLPRRRDTYLLDVSRGDGAFGEVWSAERAEARAAEPAVAVKLVGEDFSLADPIEDLQRALAGGRARDWPQLLLACPFSIVVAELEGEEREAIFMLDLVERGYESGKALFEQPQVRDYQRRPVHERVEFAHSYARAAALLEAVGFIHGDQNIPNLMLNPDTLDTQIIDLDAGAVLAGGDERAIAEGKPDDCMPPEVKAPTPQGYEVDKSRWDAGAERWPVGTLVGYLLFGVSPAFFLRRASASAIDAYANKGPWPHIDFDDPLAAPGIEATHKFWSPCLEGAPGRAAETFVRFFRAGTRGADRPSAEEWVDALEAARERPRFVSIEAGPPVVPEGTEVVIAWHAEGADRVEHAILGELPASGEASLAVDRSGRQTLSAVNHYGRTQASTDVVRVVPLPRLTTIPMPDFPGIELQATIAPAAPPAPATPRPPRIVHSAPPAPPLPAPARGPRPLPGPPHFGELFRPISVPRRIRTMMRKEPTEWAR